MRFVKVGAIIGIGLIAALAVVATLPAAAAAARTLPDVKGHWAEEAITVLVGKGVIDGYPDGKFHPADPITRAQYLKLLVLTEETDISIGLKPSFADTANHWVHRQGYLETAVKWGVIIPSEYPNRRFEPDKAISREEMAVWTVRASYMSLPGTIPENSPLSFKDASKVSPPAVRYVAESVRLELIKGRPDNTFGPADGATRAEAATIVFRRIGRAPTVGCFQHH
ncbi:MAG: S-layer homology domain-containing protein [Bacillota bacterium]